MQMNPIKTADSQDFAKQQIAKPIKLVEPFFFKNSIKIYWKRFKTGCSSKSCNEKCQNTNFGL